MSGPVTSLPLPPHGTARPSRRWLRTIAFPVIAFILGLVMGGAGAAPDPTESAAYLSVEKEVDSLESDLEVAERDAQEALASAQEAEASQAELLALAADLEARTADLDTREQALATAEAAAAAALALPAPVVAEPVPAPADPAPVAPAPAAPANVYYKNCDAARAAGAAPVRVGDPGYASHLDRDGDGIGCES